MKNYDFKSLNDKEFEALASDLIGTLWGQRVERFKGGRDGGVDGRFFSSDSGETIIQCKHWAKTPVRTLLSSLIIEESKKLVPLNPGRYFLAVSNELSRADKKRIHTAFSPFMTSESDIFGCEDLNDLLSKFPDVERRHYKLWLHSIDVLSLLAARKLIGRSRSVIEDVLAKSAMYVKTLGHDKAVQRLEGNHVVLISGSPGVGKTTLAESIGLEYVANGYKFYAIESIEEAEEIFDGESKQFFYYDDFLGSNYLEAISPREATPVMRFINRVRRSENVRLILTSRSVILNQSKIYSQQFISGNIAKLEYEVEIKLLEVYDKARILYNHVWFSLPSEFVSEIYRDKRYKGVIKHKNFNPRLIAFITDPIKIEDIPPSDYWSHVKESLVNPSGVWQHPFDTQIDEAARQIVMIVCFNNRAIDELELKQSVMRYRARRKIAPSGGLSDLANIKHLTGSLLNRTIFPDKPLAAKISLFNPSLGDFVIQRYSEDLHALIGCFCSLRTKESLDALNGLRVIFRKLDSSSGFYGNILSEILLTARAEEYVDYPVGYLQGCLGDYLRYTKGSDPQGLAASIWRCLIELDEIEDVQNFASSMAWAYGRGLVDITVVEKYLLSFIAGISSEADIASVSELYQAFSEQADEDFIRKVFLAKISEFLNDNFDSLVFEKSIFDCVDGYSEAISALERYSENYFERFGLDYSSEDVEAAVDGIDASDLLKEYHRDDTRYSSSRETEIYIDSSVDELFDRG